MGAWLATHGLWLLGGLVLLLGIVALIAYRRRQAATARVLDGEASSTSQIASKSRDASRLSRRASAATRKSPPNRPKQQRRRSDRRRIALYGGLVVLGGLALLLVIRSSFLAPAPTAAEPTAAIVAYQGDGQLGGHQSSLPRLLGQGKPVVLNYFAGACAPCSAEMPGFEKVYESSGQRVLFVGLDVGPFTGMGSHEDASRLLQQLAIRYPAAYAVDSSALSNYGVDAMPTTLFFNTSGKLVARSSGALTLSELQTQVQKLEEASS